MKIYLPFFISILLVSCAVQKKEAKTYFCNPTVSAFDAVRDNKILNWELLDSKENLINYINENFNFSDSLIVQFCEKNMFFDFTYEVNQTGKICNIEIERKFYPNHIIEIKNFLLSIPKLNKEGLHEDTNYKYWIRFGVNIKLTK